MANFLIRNFLSIGIGVLVLAFFPPLNLHAQAPGIYGVTGTWQPSCPGATTFDINTKTLKATCKAKNGALITSSIKLTACNLDPQVFDNDGYLQCAAPDGTWGDDRAIPAGSYFESCKNITIDNSQPGHPQMRAACKAKNGALIATQLSLSVCQHAPTPLENFDGYLQCTVIGGGIQHASKISLNGYMK